ncbi:MAG: 2-(1,2-epoxy,2-dihydrophenyl)acetyl-CoA isomerase [Caulobacteraceae bacterium]|nr:2-(1,2-epoxy,2-dihydrophenyl)acetyl-CoA isomerase [Caulobacteraceae bacterium]
MTYSKLKLSLDDRVAVLTLNDPATLNAAGDELVGDLVDAIARIASGDIAARAIVITGEGRGFCSGANLQGRMGDPATLAERDVGERLETVFNPLMKALRGLPVPIVTAVNGPAAGVGASLALMGDLIVAGESAYFLQAFRRIGLVPDGGATWMLPRMVGKARAMELMLLGEKLPARTALDWGLINRCVADAELMPTALGLARELANGPASIGMIRQLVWEGLEAGHDDQLQNERLRQRQAGRTEDNLEGVRAFLDKRPAVFSGR